jgi:hypothetical protein
MKEDFITKIIHANQLSSVMNKTKWKEVASEMTSNTKFNPTVSIKYLDEEVLSGFTHLDWEWVKFGDARVIEWMDISSIKHDYVGRLVDDRETDFAPWLRQALQKHSIPFSEDNGIFRIYGYLRPNGS